jgi:hypothetical protein
MELILQEKNGTCMGGKMKTHKKERKKSRSAGRHHRHALAIARSRIGKITLTQYIYRKQEVQKHFDVKFWICVSLNFEANKLIEDIVKHILKVTGENNIDTAVEASAAAPEAEQLSS